MPALNWFWLRNTRTTTVHPLLLLLVSSYPVDPAMLGHPSFTVRERATVMMSRGMDYSRAVRLERVKPINAEAAARIKRLVDAYWSAHQPPASTLPFIDSLGSPNCCGSTNALIRHYYARGCVWRSSGTWPDYRAGTAALVADLNKWRVPPCVTRWLLAWMQTRSDAWERKR